MNAQQHKSTTPKSQSSQGEKAMKSTIKPSACGDLFALFQNDAVAWLRSLPANSVDLILTDPAYESLEEHRKKGTTTRLKVSKASSNKWFPSFPNTRFPELFQECYRVLKPNRHCYVMCDAKTIPIIQLTAQESGFHFWNTIVWDKQAIGMGYHYRNQCEFVLFFEKKRKSQTGRQLHDRVTSNLIREKRIKNKSAYPTEKPVRLGEILIRQSSKPGELVIDPFMGSSSFGEAANNNGRLFWGCDLEPSSLDVSQKRLSSLVSNEKPKHKRGKPAHEYIEECLSLVTSWKRSGLGQREYARQHLKSEVEQRAISLAKTYLCKIPVLVRQDVLLGKFDGVSRNSLLNWIKGHFPNYTEMTDKELFESLDLSSQKNAA